MKSAHSFVKRPVLHQAFCPAKSITSATERSVLSPPTYAQRTSIILRPALRPRNNGERRNIVGQRRATRTNRVLQRAFRALRPATAYRFILAIADRDMPAPGPRRNTKTAREKRRNPAKATNDLVKVKRLMKINYNILSVIVTIASYFFRVLP